MREARSERERLCEEQPAGRGDSTRRGGRGINGGQAGEPTEMGVGGGEGHQGETGIGKQTDLNLVRLCSSL